MRKSTRTLGPELDGGSAESDLGDCEVVVCEWIASRARGIDLRGSNGGVGAQCIGLIGEEAEGIGAVGVSVGGVEMAEEGLEVFVTGVGIPAGGAGGVEGDAIDGRVVDAGADGEDAEIRGEGEIVVGGVVGEEGVGAGLEEDLRFGGQGLASDDDG